MESFIKFVFIFLIKKKKLFLLNLINLHLSFCFVVALDGYIFQKMFIEFGCQIKINWQDLLLFSEPQIKRSNSGFCKT